MKKFKISIFLSVLFTLSMNLDSYATLEEGSEQGRAYPQRHSPQQEEPQQLAAVRVPHLPALSPWKTYAPEAREAFRVYYQTLAAQRNPVGMDHAGLMALYDGNFRAARYWFTLGVAFGYPPSMINLGAMEYLGLGRRASWPTAFRLFVSAVRTGNYLALFYLEHMYWRLPRVRA